MRVAEANPASFNRPGKYSHLLSSNLDNCRILLVYNQKLPVLMPPACYAGSDVVAPLKLLQVAL